MRTKTCETPASNRGSKFSRCLKGPVRILARARDFYLHRFAGCAGQVAYAGVAAGTAIHPASLPRSFSESSTHDSNYRCSEQDMRELIRIASAHGCTVRLSESEIIRTAAMKRSRTVAIGRIDEDRPCEFGEMTSLIRPAGVVRSGSCAAAGGRRRMV